MTTLQSEVPTVTRDTFNRLALEHVFCFTTSKEPSCLLMLVMYLDYQSLSLDGFQSLTPAERVSLAEVLLGSSRLN